MARTAWDDRYLASTRGQILTQLRMRSQSVDDLAAMLGLSANAVRNHLYALERDGVVAQGGLRRGAGKPAALYTLAPAAERVFPKPYALVLDALLEVLAARLPEEEIEAALVETGQRLARTLPPVAGTVEERAVAATSALADLGGLAEVEREHDRLVVRGYDCPIAGTVQHHPDACRVVQALLETLLERPVTEHCDRSGSPRCCFEVDTAS
jgi:predicted ArsR family transcriptional regulator